MTGRLIDNVYERHYVAKAIYGSVTILDVLLVMEDHPPEAWRAAGTLFGAVMAVAPADGYSETIADFIDRKRGLEFGQLRTSGVQHGRFSFPLYKCKRLHYARAR